MLFMLVCIWRIVVFCIGVILSCLFTEVVRSDRSDFACDSAVFRTSSLETYGMISSIFLHVSIRALLFVVLDKSCKLVDILSLLKSIIWRIG